MNGQGETSRHAAVDAAERAGPRAWLVWSLGA